MRRYAQISGFLFTLVSLLQLTRSLLGWPIQIATVSVPVWVSVIAFLVTGFLGFWAFQVSKQSA